MARMAHIDAEDVGARFVEPFDEGGIDGGRAQGGDDANLPLVMGHAASPISLSGLLLQITPEVGTLSRITVKGKGDGPRWRN